MYFRQKVFWWPFHTRTRFFGHIFRQVFWIFWTVSHSMAIMYRTVLQSFWVLTFCATVLGAFSVQKFCENACNRGLGGNLCRCNGFHFAGKRTVLEDVLPVPNSYSSFTNEEPVNRREQVPGTYTDDLEQRGTNSRADNLSTIDKIRETKMFIQWLLNNVRLFK